MTSTPYRSVPLALAFACLGVVSGWGARPATVADATEMLNLATFPLADNAVAPQQRTLASLSYQASGTVTSVFEFQRRTLTSKGWKELDGSLVNEQSGSGNFTRNGFIVSVMVFPAGPPGAVSVTLTQHGNVALNEVPLPPGTKPTYVGPITALYVADGTPEAAAEACRTLLTAQGWVPYGAAGDTRYYKQNAVRLDVNVQAAPAQAGKTMISLTSALMSTDLPAPPEANELRYSDLTGRLDFNTTKSVTEVGDFYRAALAPAGWKSTMDKAVDVDGKDTVIFRNPNGDMITLQTRAAFEKAKGLDVTLEFQNAATIKELDARNKAAAVAFLKKKAEAEAAPVATLAIPVPAGAKGVTSTKNSVKFTIANGKAKSVVEQWKKDFEAAGWTVGASSLDPMAGMVSLSQEEKSLTINYTDTGFLPAEVSVTAIGITLERTSAKK